MSLPYEINKGIVTLSRDDPSAIENDRGLQGLTIGGTDEIHGVWVQN